MNTTTSIVFHSGALIPHRTDKAVMNEHSRAFLAKISTVAEGFAHTLDRATLSGSENFYRDHVTAIFMAIYAEVACGPLMGALAVYLYSH